MYTEQDKMEMNKRQGKVDIGQGVGNSLTNAIVVSKAILEREKSVMATREDYEKEIKYWLEFLFNVSREKIEEEFRNWININYPEPDEIDTSDIQLP
jgi:predicted subunit of tRNA(5-methylaminomethyl-2-thiouridylate) methyltransferase